MKPSWADALRGPVAFLIATIVALWLPSCASPRVEPGPAIERGASHAFLEAWEASRAPGFAGDVAARAIAIANAERALALDPGWVAPERFVDEWKHRPNLTMPSRFAAHVEGALAGHAESCYLAGRLGGDAGKRLLERSVEIDPRLGWGWHGLAWQSYLAGDNGRAVRLGRRAVDVARDAHELALFSWALARYHSADDDFGRAREVLVAALARNDALRLRPSERQYVEAELAAAEMESEDEPATRRGAQRALRVLSRPGLTSGERLVLSARARAMASDLVTQEEVDLANAAAAQQAEGDDERAAIRDVLDSLGGGSGRGRATAQRPASWRERLPLAFGGPVDSGEVGAAVEDWRRALPEQVKDEAGMPLRPELHAVVLEVRALEAGPLTPGRIESVGEVLLAAGWFQEARAWARARIDDAPEIARSLEVRALRGRATLASVLALARRVDAREAFVGDGATGSVDAEEASRRRVGSTRALHDEIVALFRRSGSLADEEGAIASPRIEYGPIGSVVHPGPTFSAEDERLDRGTAGEAVPGLASLFGALGRFALIGNGAGQGGPDATVLRIVHVEERAGAHGGRPYRGTVFWCEGADVPGRFGRLGAAISGAALHEGFYVDLEIVARDVEHWRELQDRFEGRPDALAAALDVQGAARENVVRTETTPALGAADRMRLSFLSEGRAGGLRTLGTGDLAHVVATHEEGHLCDRAGWYPLTFGRTLELIGLVASHGFSGSRIAEALEERAQLVALYAAEDPRIAWIDLLEAAEVGGTASVTPHASAYRRLLEDLVERLEAEFEAGEWEGRGVEPGCRWVDQIHRLDAEDLRGLALREARSRGLARE